MEYVDGLTWRIIPGIGYVVNGSNPHLQAMKFGHLERGITPRSWGLNHGKLTTYPSHGMILQVRTHPSVISVRFEGGGHKIHR